MAPQCLQNKIQIVSWPRQFLGYCKSCFPKLPFVIPFILLNPYQSINSSSLPNIPHNFRDLELCCSLYLDSFFFSSSLLLSLANAHSSLQIKLRYYILNEACEVLTIIDLFSPPSHHGTAHMLLTALIISTSFPFFNPEFMKETQAHSTSKPGT